MTDEVNKLTIQVRAPRGTFPGEVVTGHYVVFENHVILTDADGSKPLGSDKRRLNLGEDAHLVACRLVRRSQSSGRLGGFNSPMNYPRLKF